MNSRVLIYAVALGWWIAFATAVALTPKEREKIALAVKAIDAGIAHNKALQEAAKMSDIISENALATARLAVDSAQTSETKAALAEALEKRQHENAVKLEKENRELRELKKKVSGPWWCPGLNALIYGAKKSALSVLVIVVGVTLIGFALKIFAPGVFTAIKLGGKAVGGFFGKLGKGSLATVKRWSKKKKDDNIKHRTIGSDD